MTSGGNNFIDFPENQLTKFRAICHQKKNYFPQIFSGSIVLPPVSGLDAPDLS